MKKVPIVMISVGVMWILFTWTFLGAEYNAYLPADERTVFPLYLLTIFMHGWQSIAPLLVAVVMPTVLVIVGIYLLKRRN